MHATSNAVELSGRPSDDFPLYRPVAEEMRIVRDRLRKELSSEETTVDGLCRHVARYQGKMLRPAVLLLSGRCFGLPAETHLRFAVIIELVHLATLIHDDVLDQAQVRRRVMTVNRLRGNEASVLLGDLLLSKAFDLCNEAGDGQASRELSRMAKSACQGELLQCLSRTNWDLSEERYLQIIEMKTASLFEFCCRLGARLSGAGPEDQDHLARYGRRLGIAFQIADDLLDIIGREDETGKTLGTDLTQGKPTLPLIHFCREADPDRRRRLIRSFEDPDTSRGDVRAVLDGLGSLEYAWNRAQGLVAGAQEELETLKASPARDALAAVGDFVVKRTW